MCIVPDRMSELDFQQFSNWLRLNDRIFFRPDMLCIGVSRELMTDTRPMHDPCWNNVCADYIHWQSIGSYRSAIMK